MLCANLYHSNSVKLLYDDDPVQ